MAAFRLDISGNTRGLRRELKRARRSVRQFKQDVQSAGGGFAGYAAGVQGMVRSLGGVPVVAAAAGGAALAVAKVGFAMANEFDLARKSIIRATGASGDALDGLMNTARSITTALPVDIRDAADAVGILATAFSDEMSPSVKDVTLAVAQFSEITGASLQAVATSVGRVANMFDTTSDEVRGTLDVFTFVGMEYGIAAEELLSTLERIGPAAKSLHLDVEQTADLIGQMTKQGIRSRDVVTAFQAISDAAVRMGREPADVLRQMIADVGEATTRHQAMARIAENVTGPAVQTLTAAIYDEGLAIADSNELLRERNGLLEATAEQSRSVSDQITQDWNVVKDFVGGVFSDIAQFGISIGNWTGDAAGWLSGLVENDRVREARSRARRTASSNALHESGSLLGGPVVTREMRAAQLDEQMSAALGAESLTTRRHNLLLLLGAATREGFTEHANDAREAIQQIDSELTTSQRAFAIERTGARVTAGLADPSALTPLLQADVAAQLPGSIAHAEAVTALNSHLEDLGTTTAQTTQALSSLRDAVYETIDGVVRLNDAGVPEWQPDEVIGRTVAGNRVTTTLRRASSVRQPSSQGSTAGNFAGLEGVFV